MKPWQAVLTGVAAYVVFLLATAPAAKLLPLVQPRLGGVQLAGVDGTLWSGSAAVAAANPVQLQDVQWRLRPLALLLGRAEVALEASWQGRPAAALAGKALFGGSYLADVSATLPAPDVLRWLEVRQVSVEGNLALDLARLEWPADGALPAITGAASWTPARVSAPVEVALGSAQLDTVAEQGVTRGKLKTSGGALLVDADLKQQAIHKKLGYTSPAGLSDYLLYDTPMNDLIVWPGIEKLTIISGGRTIDNSTELLGSNRMGELVHEMKTRYDDRYVFFDVPPLINVADAVAFAPIVDAILIVVEEGKTSNNHIKTALQMIPQDKFLGFVMNRKK